MLERSCALLKDDVIIIINQISCSYAVLYYERHSGTITIPPAQVNQRMIFLSYLPIWGAEVYARTLVQGF
jgi:hypothetical protein